MSSVVFYISGHGFGHATRQIAVINALAAARPDLPVVVRSSAPGWLFARTARAALTVVPGETDTGIVQIDSLHLDERATIARAAGFTAGLDERARAEAGLLRRHGARLVVADAPPLACAAAALAGIPSVVCANFTWDWIYRGYPDAIASAPGLVSTLQQAYAKAAAAWRLPMHGGFEAIGPILDVPFVARHARRDVSIAEVRGALGLPADRRLALVSFGGYGLGDLPLEALDCLADWGVVVTARGPAAAPLPAGVFAVPESAIYERGFRYEDLVRAADAVVTKPGYGIISDCVANGTAMLYTSRGRFAEYDVLVAEMPRVLRCRFIDLESLLAGRWHAALGELAASPPPPERPRTDGAEVVAALILNPSQPWSLA